MNAGPKQSLRSAHAVKRAAEAAPKFRDVLWCAVGQRILGFGPDELIRVDLRGVCRKAMGVKSLVLAQELLDDDALVDGAAIPEQDNRSPQVPEEVAQESNDLHSGDVGRVQWK